MVGISPVLVLAENARTTGERWDGNPCSTRVLRSGERIWQNFDIFEGTEQIQQLVIARAISGLRIE